VSFLSDSPNKSKGNSIIATAKKLAPKAATAPTKAAVAKAAKAAAEPVVFVPIEF